MNRCLFYCILFTFLFLSASAQEKPEYAVSLIPDSLKKEVNSVIREQSDILVFKSPGRGKQTIKKVVTVLNDKAESELMFYEFYDQFRKIDDIEVNVYDEKGNYLKRSRKRDLRTQSVGDGISLLTDTKVIYASLSVDKYPVTIEINYEIIYEGTHEYRDFFPQTTDQSIMLKWYSITTPNNNKVRYKNYRTNLQPAIKNDGANTTLTWQVRNVQPYKKEPGSAHEDVPTVMIAPTLFEVDNYPGALDSWDNFGKWNVALQKGINKLPASSIPYYQELTKNAQSVKEKIEILYRHLQENYRYVSIQLGIGGNKPFPAEFVEKKKYGDCKALSNFMHAMLDAVGIQSYYTVINAEYNSMPVDKDFPQDAFNHIILCVPLPKEKDTVWLECTSRTEKFGKLGSFTENRYGLMVTETGGILVPTPRSKAEDNILKSYSVIKISEDLTAKASMTVSHTGNYTSLMNSLFESSEDDRRHYLVNQMGLKHPDQLSMKKSDESLRHDYKVLYELGYEKIAEFSAGSKHFINPRLYKFWNNALPKTENRQNAYYFRNPLILIDTSVYELPAGFIVENLPKPSSVNFSLGSYQTTYSFDASKRVLTTTAKIQLDKHIIPATNYEEAAKFFSDVIREQQQKIVIKKE